MDAPEPIWQLSYIPYGGFTRMYLALEALRDNMATYNLSDNHYRTIQARDILVGTLGRVRAAKVVHSLLRSLKGVALTKWTHHAR